VGKVAEGTKEGLTPRDTLLPVRLLLLLNSFYPELSYGAESTGLHIPAGSRLGEWGSFTPFPIRPEGVVTLVSERRLRKFGKSRLPSQVGTSVALSTSWPFQRKSRSPTVESWS
jgi:hypothetical protein